jgi:hypothetical protein
MNNIFNSITIICIISFFSFELRTKPVSYQELEEKARFLEKIHHNFNFPVGFDWCTCISNRDRIEFVQKVLKKLTATKSPYEKITYVSIGVGQLLQDLLTIYGILKSGYKNLDIVLIDLHFPSTMDITQKYFRADDYKKLMTTLDDLRDKAGLKPEPEFSVFQEFQEYTPVEIEFKDTETANAFAQYNELIGQEFDKRGFALTELFEMILAHLLQELGASSPRYWKDASINLTYQHGVYEALGLFKQQEFKGKKSKQIFDTPDILLAVDSLGFVEKVDYPAEANLARIAIEYREPKYVDVIAKFEVVFAKPLIVYGYNKATLLEEELNRIEDFKKFLITSKQLSKSQLAEEVERLFENIKNISATISWEVDSFLALRDFAEQAADNKTIIGVLSLPTIKDKPFDAEENNPLPRKERSIIWDKASLLKFKQYPIFSPEGPMEKLA